MTVIIDPEIVLLPNDHKIFVLHPGESKKFYKEFVELSAVFLDFPGVQQNDEPNYDDKTLWNRLRMSRAIASWHRQDKPDDKKPSRDFTDYRAPQVSNDQPRYLHEFIDLYSEAKKGDLVVVPGPGLGSIVYFGELLSNFDPDVTVESERYPFEPIPSRSVKWLPIRARKAEFSPRLIQLMQNRSALIRVKNEPDVREVYLAAYGNYIWNDMSGNLFRTKKEHIDLNDLGEAIELVNYFAAQYLALKSGKLAKFLEIADNDMRKAKDAYYDKAFFGSVDVEIHSPGTIGRVIQGATIAAYISTMIALSASDVEAAAAGRAKVKNSASPVPTACDLDLETDVQETMNLYANYDLWKKKVCPKSRKSKENIGLEPDVKIKAQ